MDSIDSQGRDMDGIFDRSPKLCRWIAGLLILAAALLRLAYLAWFSPLNLAPDEAHYWDWSRHLDWSYYSKGPLVALIIRASLTLFGPMSIALTGGETLAVRIPAVIFGSLLLVGLYTLSAQVFNREKWSLAIVAVAVASPIVSAGSSLMTIDAPFMCLWTWALVAGHRAFVGRSIWAWTATGALIALGILAKHTMVLWIPCFGLFLICTPSLRPLLRSGGFWTMSAIAGLGVLPILGWNAANGWVTLLHTQGHAGVTSPRLIHWFGPAVYFGIQFALLLGIGFVCWTGAMIRFRPRSDDDPARRYLWFMSAPIILFFAAFSFKNGGGEPNWPLAGYLSGLVLTAAWLAEQFRSPIAWYRRSLLATCLLTGCVGLVGSVVVHMPLAFQPFFAAISGPASEQRPMPMRRFDPTCRLRGWTTLAREVDKVRGELKTDGIDPILVGTSWSFPGELGFYCEGHPPAYSIGIAFNDRNSQYELWRPHPVLEPAPFLGKTFVVVGANDGLLSPYFDRVEPTRGIEHRENGLLIAAWTVTVCRGFRGFPEKKSNGF